MFDIDSQSYCGALYSDVALRPADICWTEQELPSSVTVVY